MEPLSTRYCSQTRGKIEQLHRKSHGISTLFWKFHAGDDNSWSPWPIFFFFLIIPTTWERYRWGRLVWNSHIWLDIHFFPSVLIVRWTFPSVIIRRDRGSISYHALVDTNLSGKFLCDGTHDKRHTYLNTLLSVVTCHVTTRPAVTPRSSRYNIHAAWAVPWCHRLHAHQIP